MTQPLPNSAPSNTTPPPAELAYATAEPAQTRPWWVYTILLVYLLLFAAVLTLPAWTTGTDNRVAAGAVIAVLTLCSWAMLLTPIRVHRQRRSMTRRSILIPIITSGFLLGCLVAGAGFALAELWAPSTTRRSFGGSMTDHVVGDSTLRIVAIVAGAVWLAWSILFALVARSTDPTSLGMKLHRALIAGSVLELVVAVPAHIIVRRRTDCCAGMLTGTGICVGAAVALVAFGPSVLLLYYKRSRQITPVAHVASRPARIRVNG